MVGDHVDHRSISQNHNGTPSHPACLHVESSLSLCLSLSVFVCLTHTFTALTNSYTLYSQVQRQHYIHRTHDSSSQTQLAIACLEDAAMFLTYPYLPIECCRLLNPADPDRGCTCSRSTLGTTVQFTWTSSLKFQASRLSIGFSVTSYTREGGQLGSYRVMGASMLDVQRSTVNGSS